MGIFQEFDAPEIAAVLGKWAPGRLRSGNRAVARRRAARLRFRARCAYASAVCALPVVVRSERDHDWRCVLDARAVAA
jgi:hypothetical protein